MEWTSCKKQNLSHEVWIFPPSWDNLQESWTLNLKGVTKWYTSISLGEIITVIIIIIKIIMIITLDSNTNIQYFKRETPEVIPIRKAS